MKHGHISGSELLLFVLDGWRGRRVCGRSKGGVGGFALLRGFVLFVFEQREQNERNDRKNYDDDKAFDDSVRLEARLAPGCWDHVEKLNWILAGVGYHGSGRLAT